MTKGNRNRLSDELERKILTKSNRRCCLCVYIDGDWNPKSGQIAHLNHKSSDSKFENLVFLCLAHHDQFDSTTSQSKGLKVNEVRHYRDKLYEQISKKHSNIDAKLTNIPQLDKAKNRLNNITAKDPDRYSFFTEAWTLSDYPEETLYLFPYKSPNGYDGICLLERFHLATGETVIILSEAFGNPGISITNAIEAIVTQVCAYYGLEPKKIICLEHHKEYANSGEKWLRVNFNEIESSGVFKSPQWNEMDKREWYRLGLRPKKLDGYYDQTLVKRVN